MLKAGSDSEPPVHTRLARCAWPGSATCVCDLDQLVTVSSPLEIYLNSYRCIGLLESLCTQTHRGLHLLWLYSRCLSLLKQSLPHFTLSSAKSSTSRILQLVIPGRRDQGGTWRLCNGNHKRIRHSGHESREGLETKTHRPTVLKWLRHGLGHMTFWSKNPTNTFRIPGRRSDGNIKTDLREVWCKSVEWLD